ncbi:hypothetical protein ACVNIS_06485 [Sphaerotilaceae bacterium SBD11-9]
MKQLEWLSEAARLAKQRAPQMTDQHAQEMAGDLYRAWPERSPGAAVALFFAFLPPGWKGALASAESLK